MDEIQATWQTRKLPVRLNANADAPHNAAGASSCSWTTCAGARPFNHRYSASMRRMPGVCRGARANAGVIAWANVQGT